MAQGTLNFLNPTPLPGQTEPNIPFVIVGDDAFPLMENLMKPYSRRNLTDETRIYNYRHSRARRISENAFGILANRWRVFMSPMLVAPDKVENITLCCVALHNYLRSTAASRQAYTPEETFDVENHASGNIQSGNWHRNGPIAGWENLGVQRGNRYRLTAKAVRDELCKYFNSEEGNVPWQRRMVGLDGWF